MTFDPRFPTDLSLGAAGGCGWRTGIAVTGSGTEYRIGRWHQSMGQWVVGKNLQNRSQWEALIAFHRVMQGPHGVFRFKDWTDFSVTGGVLMTLAGSTVLAAKYLLTDVFGGSSFALRAITRPVPGTISFNDGSVVAYETGVVTGGNINTTTWSGQFDVPVRFSEDNPEISLVQSDVGSWKGITLLEVRDEP